MAMVIIEERKDPEAQQRQLDRALRELQRKVVHAGIFDELRKRDCFRSPKEMREYKRAVANKKRRQRRKRREARNGNGRPQAATRALGPD